MKRLWCLGLIAALSLCGWAAKPVSEQVLLYPSVDQFGQTITLSGKLSVPQNRTAKGIILVTHYTIYSLEEAPSVAKVAKGIESKMFYKDYILVIPDYQGYGISKDSVPPYLCGELTARQCVDMYLAAQKTLDSLNVGINTDSLYVVGFSQGGATALWTLRLLEEQYAGQLFVKACYAGSGPYDVAATYDYAVQHNDAGFPATIPMLVMGTSTGYDLHLTTDSFYTAELDKIYNAYIAPKKLGLLAILLKMPYGYLHYWLTDAGMDKSRPESQRLYEGLLRSSLVHYPMDDHPIGQNIICPQWKPTTPTYVFHSTQDDIVNFCNAEHLKRCWLDASNVTFDYGQYGNHLRSCRLFFKIVRKQLP